MKKQETSTVDVLSNSLNPAMKVISETEKKKLLEQYNINEGQLPKILSTDPAVTALKAKTGDVIKIQRNDGTGAYPEYRLVIES